MKLGLTLGWSMRIFCAERRPSTQTLGPAQNLPQWVMETVSSQVKPAGTRKRMFTSVQCKL